MSGFPFRRRVKDRVVFLHIPRCGGSSLRSAMAAHYPRRDRLKFAPKATRFVTQALDIDAKKVREALFLYFLDHGDPRFITGHFSFSEKGWEHARGQWKFVSMIRHPVDRWFSSYFYRRHSTGRFKRTDLSLEAFLETPRAGFMGRRIVRGFSGDVDERTDPDAAVERAKVNLARLDVLGVLSRMDAFREQYFEKLGVRLSIPRDNVSPRRREDQERDITDGIRARVEELCAPDLEVYRYAEKELAP